VAEGIEDDETLQRLRELGCELGQGYHISCPLPVAELDRWWDGAPGSARNGAAPSLSGFMPLLERKMRWA